MAVALLASVLVSPAAAAMNDPTRPPFRDAAVGKPSSPQPYAAAWQLSSTLVAAGRRVAVINGKAVSVGDYVAGARVMQVEAASVVLRRDGRDFTLRLAQNIKDISKTPAEENRR